MFFTDIWEYPKYKSSRPEVLRYAANLQEKPHAKV